LEQLTGYRDQKSSLKREELFLLGLSLLGCMTRSALRDDIVLAKLLLHDRAIVLVGAAFIALIGWAYLFYEGWAMQHMDLVAMAMPSTGAWGSMDLLVVFAMWAVMMVAMMVPSATPMLLTFATIARSRRAQERPLVPVWVFLGGYLVLWTAFSLAATLAQWALHSLVLISPMMVGTSPVLGSVLLVVAGVYQWTPFKQACLRHCRTPLQFLLTYWKDGTVGAFFIGLRHGAYCLGCCWLLMGILFAVGVMNLAWIAALSVFVLLEKIIPRGLWVAKVAGLILIGFGGWMALSAGT
jgi:predicted metal-binding membrane protein